MAIADELMIAGGWTATDDDRVAGATFVRPVAEGFIATAELSAGRGPIRSASGGDWQGHEPPLTLSATVGVSCPAADRVMRAVAGMRFGSAVSEEAGELLMPPQDATVHVARVEEVRPALESLVALVDEVAMPFAMARASFDALMADLPTDGGYLPALLTAFNRVDEAREALARFDETADSPEARRFSRQFKRLLDREVTIEELETAIPPRTGQPRASREKTTVRATAERQRNMRAALDAVRSAGSSMTRDQRRVLLRAELEKRGVRGTPLGIEAQLDTLEPGYEPSSTLGVLASLGKGVVEVVRLLRSGEPLGVDEPPAWLEPPERAGYRITIDASDSIGVAIDSDARDWLDRVHEALAPRVGSTAPVTVWLDRGTGVDNTPTRLVVSIGARPVGLLDAEASQVFASAMTAARARDELPQALGALTKRSSEPKYVLAVYAPAADAAR